MKLIDVKSLKSLKGVPFSRAHIYRLIKSGEFPKPIKIGAARVAWLESDLDSWISTKLAA
ncbi:AlpA family phage regulatory protein [Aminobacter aminovorans]|uniref:helix-turn-helix transcriptional regulator n=1 Tax=Aminobacter aminovorans TaxID=83263 RepID=UPI00285AC523|nr:AlpA family phage regulatory protein [Aminobacter aminovorans]MDR7219870.1 prophage regulatory protein [Aminobacter aminovorans]